MDMDCKFLSDGRKVALVGKLNNEQWIVQEVFVTASGDEIPSGERFVVTSLHDAPLESWKAKDARQLEQRVTKLKAEIDALGREHRDESLKAAARADVEKFVRQVTARMDEGELSTLANYMSGNIKWLVAEEYGFIEPEPFSEKMADRDSWGGIVKHDGLKLLSLYGKSDGSLSYRLSHYRDGSGSSVEVFGFSTYEEAARAAIAMNLARIEEGRTDGIEKLPSSALWQHMTKDERSAVREHLIEWRDHQMKHADEQCRKINDGAAKKARELDQLLASIEE